MESDPRPLISTVSRPHPARLRLATYPDLSAYGMWPPALPVLPLDHLYAPPSMHLRKIERIAGIGSDHLGVRAEFTRDLDQDTR